MKTYLKVMFNSEGAKPSAVMQALVELGFQPTKGSHDFAYEWPSAPSVDEVLRFGDRIQTELSGMQVLFEMETL